jgi:hypothetical protein
LTDPAPSPFCESDLGWRVAVETGGDRVVDAPTDAGGRDQHCTGGNPRLGGSGEDRTPSTTKTIPIDARRPMCSRRNTRAITAVATSSRFKNSATVPAGVRASARRGKHWGEAATEADRDEEPRTLPCRCRRALFTECTDGGCRAEIEHASDDGADVVDDQFGRWGGRAEQDRGDGAPGPSVALRQVSSGVAQGGNATAASSADACVGDRATLDCWACSPCQVRGVGRSASRR